MKYSDEQLVRAIADSASFRAAFSLLGVPMSSGASRSNLRRRAAALNVDTTHFSAAALNAAKRANSRRRTSDSIFRLRTFDEGRERSSVLRNAMLEGGTPHECKECHLVSWREKSLRLEVDHINGNPLDNRRFNLRFLCPNCHSQTADDSSQRIGAKRRRCISCDAELSSNRARKCIPCSNRALGGARRGTRAAAQIRWPTYSSICRDIEARGWEPAAANLGVTSNALRKRLREHAGGLWPTSSAGRPHNRPRTLIVWPSQSELQQLVDQMGATRAAQLLGCRHPESVRRRLKRPLA